MKKRVPVAILLWLLLSAVALPLCYNLDRVLSGQGARLSFDVGQILDAVTGNGQLLYLWLLVSALCGLFVIWALVGSAWIKSQNKLYRVIPGVEIPVPSGRGEHGTAWWMSRKKMRHHWLCVTVDKEMLCDLLEKGAAEAAEIQRLRNDGKLNAMRMLDGKGVDT